MTELEIKKQIALFKECGVTDYKVEDGEITIGGNLDLEGLTTVHEDFLKGTTIGGCLYLRGLTTVHEDFLKGTTIGGGLYLRDLTTVDKDFLKGTTIGGSLGLRGLTTVHEDFLKCTTIGGSLDLEGLTTVDKDFLKGTTIGGNLDLEGLTTVHEDFLKGTTIGGSLNLEGLTTVDKDFLKGTTIGRYLYLEGLTTVHEDFLKGTTIGGSLNLEGLTTVDKDFLKGTTIGRYLYLEGLTTVDRIECENNVNELKEGYNEEKSYCYFDRIIRKVNRVSTFKDYTVYSTPFDYVIQKGKYTSHAKSVKKGVLDLEFKIIAEKLKNEPIAPDTELTIKYYRTLTGACDLGVREWMQRNKLEFNVIEGETVEVNPIKAKDLLPILEETNAYGVEKFKSLVTF